MFSPADFHHEMRRFRQQMNHLFNDFNRSVAMENDPFLATPWYQPLSLADERTVAVEASREQKESGEQKYTANASGNQMAVESTNSSSTGAPSTTAPGTTSAPDTALSNQQSQQRENTLRPWRHWLSSGNDSQLLPSFNSVSIPRVDLVEKDDHFLLNCDLPGMAKEEVKVAVTPNGMLSIDAEHSEKHEQKDDKAKYHRIERSYGKFRRSMQLPENVDADAVKAKHENGLLQVTLPKKPKTESKETKNVPIH